MTLKAVVLPAPFGPIRPEIVPFATSNDTASSATMPPKRRVTSLTERSIGAGSYWGGRAGALGQPGREEHPRARGAEEEERARGDERRRHLARPLTAADARAEPLVHVLERARGLGVERLAPRVLGDRRERLAVR